ncbi:prefoldin chaperone 1 [Haematococcus lacustris]
MTELVVPRAEFISDVAAYLQDKQADIVIQQFNEHHRKFKMVEGQMLQRKARLMSKLPEIQKALDIVTVLHEQGSAGDMVLDYELAESVYAKTRVSKVKHVNLWLGADVMVEYGLDEAKELLTNNLANCKANILNCNKDLEVVKDNLTTLEVSISRVWNFDVDRRRRAKEMGQPPS